MAKTYVFSMVVGSKVATVQKVCGSVKTAKKQLTKLNKLAFAPNIVLGVAKLAELEAKGIRLFCP